MVLHCVGVIHRNKPAAEPNNLAEFPTVNLLPPFALRIASFATFAIVRSWLNFGASTLS